MILVSPYWLVAREDFEQTPALDLTPGQIN
jgi:hypothetical protein